MSSNTADLRYLSAPSSDVLGHGQTPLVYPTQLYPPIEPFASAHLDVGSGHRIYYEQNGNPDGIPVLFLHGGPGGGCSPRSRRFFDPAVYMIVCFDQRGCGRSAPNAADDWEGALLDNNTTTLVSDAEAIREVLGVSKWGVVLGGSWGSTLALALAEAHVDRVRSLLLRGVFLFGPDEVDYLFSTGGTFGQHPAAWTSYSKFIEDTSTDWEREKTNLLGAYLQRLTSGDAKMQNAAAAAFVAYELSISKTFTDTPSIEARVADPSKMLPFALMEVVFMCNGGFVRRGELLDKCAVLKDIPVHIVHGRCDFVCQPQAAYRLAEALKKAGNDKVNLEFVAGAGHSDTEPGNTDAMVRATNNLKAILLK